MKQIAPKANTTIAYTDGACKNNPGVGGWGAYLIFADGSEQELYGGDAETTNNQMEMLATIQAILHSPANHLLEIWTDSSYVKNGITKWIDGWKKNGWKTAAKKPVKNQELWQQLDDLNLKRNISWNWIKGHAGHYGNEKADELANMGVLNPLGNSHNINQDITINDDDNNNNNNSDNDSAQDMDWLWTDSEENEEAQEDETLELNCEPQNLTGASDASLAVLPNQTTQPVQHIQPVQSASQHNGFSSHVPHDDNSYQQPQPQQTHMQTISNDMTNGMTNDQSGFMPQQQNQFEQQDDIQAAQQFSNMVENNVVESVVDSMDESLPEFDGDTSRANPHFRPLLPVPKHKGKANRQLIMDTETTGLDPNNGDRVIEVGIVELVNRKFTGEKLHVYTNPKRGMDDEVIRVHGITEAFLADMPTFDKVAKQVYDFMDGAEVIAHNASFDMNFLNMEFAKVGMSDFASRVKVTDTLAMAKQQYPGQKNTLDALVRRLNVGKQDRTFHGALLDSEILAEVYLAMTGGQVSLAIDDETGDDGEIAHKSFAKLANMLLKTAVTSDDNSHHQHWLDKISQKNPAVADLWQK